jgi:arylsulfatase A-like enzyme
MTLSHDSRSAAAAVLRAGVVLAIALFAVESSVTHLLSARGDADRWLTWVQWSRHLGIYVIAGLIAGGGPALVARRTRSPHDPSYFLAVVPRILLVIYAVVLLLRGPIELAPIVSPALLLVGAFWIYSALHRRRLRGRAARSRSMAFATECVTWAALFYLSIAPLAASHLNKRSIASSNALILNVLIPVGCLVVSALVVWYWSRPALNRGAIRVSPWRAIAMAVGAAGYVLLAVVAHGGFTWTPVTQASPLSSGRPDLVLVIVDALRADRLGAYGYRHGRTPHLDSVAARAVLYADHVSASPWTLPSFASLFTGRSPTVHGARRLSWPRDPEQQAGVPELGIMRADLATLPTILKEQGYETAFIGTNWALSGAYGLARGFDVYSDPLTTDFYVTLGAVLGTRQSWERTIDAAEMTDRFLAYLEKRRDRPVALVAHYIDPHVPYAPPARFRTGAYEPRTDAGAAPLEVMSPDSVSSLYDGEVSYVDEQFGRLWRYLEQTGRLNRTILALTADHGEMLNVRAPRPDLIAKRPAVDAGVYRALDHGHNLYQDLLHVPFILYGPTVEPRVEKRMTRAIDVLPTLLAALQVNIPPGLEGRSVLAAVETDQPALSESVLYGLEKKSWRQGAYKLIHRSEYPEDVQFELYDLTADRRESRDLAPEQPERVRMMSDRMRSYLRRLSQAPPSTAPIDRETIERLRSLGYVK